MTLNLTLISMRHAALVTLALCLGACSSISPTLRFGKESSVAHRAPRSLDLTPAKQENESLCGLAAVEMLSGYYHLGMPEAQRQQLRLEARETGALLGSTLKKALQDSGYAVSVFPGALDDGNTGLYHHLDRGRPLIVLLSARKGKSGHYEVVEGYDPGSRELLLIDPASGDRIALPVKRFETLWDGADRFTLLAVPNEQPQSTGEKR